MYDLPEDTVDVVALGSSATMHSFDPLEIWGTFGVSAYNLGTEQQPIMASYYLLKEFCKKQSPKVVFLETTGLTYQANEAFYRIALDYLRPSADKIQAWREHSRLETADPYDSYLFPLFKYHFRWKELRGYDVNPTNKEYYNTWQYGNILSHYTNGWGGNDYAGLSRSDFGNERIPVTEEALEYFSRIVKLCEENEITLVLYSIPSGKNGANANTMDDLAKHYNCYNYTLYDADIVQEMAFNYQTDSEGGNHVNTRGAIKISDYLVSEAMRYADLTDHRTDPKYKSYADAHEQYVKCRENNALLFNDVTLESYLPMLNNSRYTVLISVRDQSCNLSETAQAELFQLGLQQPIIGSERYRFSYLAVISDGEVKHEQISDTNGQLLTYESRLPNGDIISVHSQGAGEDGLGVASVIINEREYALNRRGLNIVVYDNELEKVIDSIAFDTHDESQMSR